MTTLNAATNLNFTNPQNDPTASDTKLASASAQLTEATSSNDFMTARKVLAENPDQKDALLAKLSQTDAGAYYRLSNPSKENDSQTTTNSQASVMGTPSAKPASAVLFAGNTKPAVIEINVGQNHHVNLIERVTGAFGRTVYSNNPDYEVARYVAKSQFNITTKSQIDGSSTLPLPNTRKGGEILARIQTTNVGFSGTSMDSHPLLSIPKEASKEFREGYYKVMDEAGKAAMINAVTTVGGGAINARTSRPNVDMTPARNVPTQNRSASGQERVVSPLAPKSGNLPISGTTGTGWRGKQEPAQPWNTAKPIPVTDTNGNATNSYKDCGWCTLEVITGQPRAELSKFTSNRAIDNVKVDEVLDLPKAQRALKGMDLKPERLGVNGDSKTEILAKMLKEPVGTRFLIDGHNTPVGKLDNNHNNGEIGHMVAAVRTKEGFTILDGQSNRQYPIASLEDLRNCRALPFNTLQAVRADAPSNK